MGLDSMPEYTKLLPEQGALDSQSARAGRGSLRTETALAQSVSDFSGGSRFRFEDQREALAILEVDKDYRKKHGLDLSVSNSDSGKRVSLKNDSASIILDAPEMPHDKVAVFDPNTKTLTLPDGRKFKMGSGKGFDAKTPDGGVIPPGTWLVAKAAKHDFKLVNGIDTCDAFYLSPTKDVELNGRDGFYIHHPHSPNLSSLGCPVADDKCIAALKVAREKDIFTSLRVLPYDPKLAATHGKKAEKVVKTKQKAKKNIQVAMTAPVIE